MQGLPTNNRQRAKDLSKSLHWVNLFITIIIIAISVANWQCLSPTGRLHNFCIKNSDSDSQGSDFFLLLIIGELLFIFLYFKECQSSATRSYLKTDMKIQKYESFVREMKASPPQLGTRIECYHYESSSGDDYDSRSVTFTGTSFWNYKSWNDATGEIVGMNERKMIKLEVVKSYTFASDASNDEFQKHKRDYIHNNKHRDDKMDVDHVFEIGGYAPHVLVQNEGAKTHDCMSGNWYWFWSLLMLSWPYRMWFECMTVNKRIEVKKVVCGFKDQEAIL